MTQAGWYPDPAGRPQTYRYWDGSSWSEQTTGNPYDAPPGAAAGGAGSDPAQGGAPPTMVSGGQAPGGQPPGYPQQPPQQPPPQPPQQQYGAVPPHAAAPGAPGGPGGYGQPPYGGPPPSGGGGSGKVVLIVLAAVLLIAGLGVGGFFVARALTGDDDTDADSDSTSETTEEDPTEDDTTDASPTEDTTDGPDVEFTEGTGQQCFGGNPNPSAQTPASASEISGGGLTVPLPDGYEPEVRYSPPFTWADDFTPALREIAQNEGGGGWVSVYGVGALQKSNGYDDPKQAAEVVMACMSNSPDLYEGFNDRTDLRGESVTIDGRDAYSLVSELRVDQPDLEVEGDVAQVIVVDTGNPETFGLYITVVPIGDDELIEEQAAVAEQITTD